MTDNNIVIALGLALAVLQFLYRIWDKKDNKLVIDTITRTAKEVYGGLEDHVERGKRTLGIVKDLKGMHEIRDDDGRPMWYMPKEIMETQRELVTLTTILAQTQKDIIRIIEKLEFKIDNHQQQCQDQFNTLDKKTS